MQLPLLQYVIAITSFTYHTSSALVTTFQIPANQNQTVVQAFIPPPENQTILTEPEFWPIKDDYWLEIEKTTTYMDLNYVHSVLDRTERYLGKQPAGQIIPNVLSITADRTLQPYNEGEFVFSSIEGDVVTVDDAVMSATALNSWYKQEPLIDKKFAVYFWLHEQVEKGRRTYGAGGLKRTWQPYPPPSIAVNVSLSR